MLSKATPLSGAKNINTSVDGKVLHIYADLSKDFGVSTSGKSVIIASSSGNKPLGSSNAFIGINLFTKSLEKRDLSDSGVSELCTEAFQDVGEGCSWRIEADKVTLAIRIDFSTIKGRTASSGKSVLLATSSGNKAISKTGIMCGLNCYVSTTATFEVDKLGEEGNGDAAVELNQKVDFDNGYGIHYVSEKEAVITFRGSFARDDSIALPGCTVGGATVSMYVSPPKAKKARKQSEEEPATASPSSGGVIGAVAAAKLRNAVLSCTREKGEDGDIELTLRFDPTHSLGRSASGKSITISTTAGFQDVAAAGSADCVCRVQLNVFRPAPPVTDADITAAVHTVLSVKPKDALSSLAFKGVFSEVLQVLELGESQEKMVKDRVIAAVKDFMKNID